MKYSFLQYIKSFFVPIKEPKKPAPANDVGYPLSWIASYFGYTDCMYGIRGQGETEGKYYLWDWLNECEKTMERNGGWITPTQVIIDGVATNAIYQKNPKSMLPYDSQNIRNINITVGKVMKKIEEIRQQNK